MFLIFPVSDESFSINPITITDNNLLHQASIPDKSKSGQVTSFARGRTENEQYADKSKFI